MSTMLQVCKAMGIPVATEKCEGPAGDLRQLPGHRAGFLPAAAQIATREAAGQLIPDQIMACQMQSYQEGTPISHWETIFCSQGSPSRPPVPTSSHPGLNNGDEATPPHLPQPRTQSRPTMVEQLPIILEWHLNVHSTRNGRMQTRSSRTPMPRLPRIWRLPGRCLVQRRLAATPAATQALHTVAVTIRHSGSSSHLGPSPGWKAHHVPLRQPAHSPVMDQPVFKAPWHNGSPNNLVLYCSQKQFPWCTSQAD